MPATDLPVLYSFRRCPYAIRARLALAYGSTPVELREIVLRDKPESLIAVSSKATVPVLVLSKGDVIDESLDVMAWALRQHDPANWCYKHSKQAEEKAAALIRENDTEFKYWLDRYKYADRFPDMDKQEYQRRCERFLQTLELQLANQPHLCSDHFGLADAAILPFIRQFAFVDKKWFAETPYPKIKHWLHEFLHSSLFSSVMHKYPQWHTGDKPTFFPTTTDL